MGVAHLWVSHKRHGNVLLYRTHDASSPYCRFCMYFPPKACDQRLCLSGFLIDYGTTPTFSCVRCFCRRSTMIDKDRRSDGTKPQTWAGAYNVKAYNDRRLMVSECSKKKCTIAACRGNLMFCRATPKNIPSITKSPFEHKLLHVLNNVSILTHLETNRNTSPSIHPC